MSISCGSWDITNISDGGSSGSASAISVVTGYGLDGQAEGDPDLYSYIKTLYDASNITGTDYLIPLSQMVGAGVDVSLDGIASGFTYTNWINTGYDFKPKSTDTWEVRIKFKTPSVVSSSTGWQTVLSSITVDLPNACLFAPFIINGSSWYALIHYWDGTQKANAYDDYVGSSSGTFSANTEYYLSCKYTGTAFVFSKYNNGSWSQVKSSNFNQAFIRGDVVSPIILGNYRGITTEPTNIPFGGSIDLKSVEFYVNDLLVYNPLTQITYKKIATGAKVADSSSASVISQFAESNGSALYYVLDTTNETVTLPQGDIFGFITQNVGYNVQ